MHRKKLIIWVVFLSILIIPYRTYAAISNFTFSQIAKLIEPESEENVFMGWNAAIDGDTLVAGVYRYQDRRGTVYIFERNQGGLDEWGLVKQLYGPENNEINGFGVSVAIEGDTLVVGEHYIGETALGAGAVLIFDRNEGGPNNWGQIAEITHADEDSDQAWLGYRVAISGDTIAASAPRQEPFPAIYIFKRDEGGLDNWGEVKEITLHDTTDWTEYGYALDLDGDNLVVGAPIDTNGGELQRGSAYLYSRNQGGTEQWGYITKVSGQARSDFGYSVALNGDTLVVGAPEHDYPGAAFTFERSQGGENNWGLSDVLMCVDSVAGIQCGYSVAIQGDLIFVGAPDETTMNAQDGMVYVFERSINNWQLTEGITANDGDRDDRFGRAVAFDDGVLAVGATGDDEAAEGAGAVYVFYSSEVIKLFLPVIIK